MIRKDIEALNNIINQLHVIDISRIFYPTKAKYTFFSGEYEIYAKLDHLMVYNKSFNKFKRIQII